MATIAEKSRTKEIIDRLQGIIDGASTVPLAPGKISIYKDEIQSLLTELANQMEIELKTYHEVNDRRGKIISEAKKEAEKIIYQAEHSASRMRVSRRTTDVAPLDYDTLDEEERSALGNANEIYGASLIYTDEMLSEVSAMISEAYQNIRSDYEIILQVFEDKLATIQNNRDELMAGLQEMDDADRSQQILEIGQLLSSELHMARMKEKENSDEYQDGSVQLTLDLQLEMEEEKTRLAEEKAQQAEEALAEMKAERDALAAAMEQLQKDQKKEENREKAESKYKEQNKEKEEYEIVYVTEDELEEGEEYEIEYVDDDGSEQDDEYEVVYVDEDELEEGEEYEVEYIEEDEEEGKAEEDEKKGVEEDNEKIPLIPHFKKSSSVASVPSEKVARMAEAMTTDEKYSGLISGAGRPKAESEVSNSKKGESVTSAKSTKDKDIKTGKDGKEYVEAKMEFAEDYEIMEF